MSEVLKKYYTPINEIKGIIDASTKEFYNGRTFKESFRRQQLYNLYNMVKDNEKLIIDTIKSDILRPTNELSLTAVSFTKSEIAHLINNLSDFMQSKKLSSPAAFMTDAGYIKPKPRGNVLIIAPWNFPFQLAIVPLAGAIAAGCTVILKPSEVSGNTGHLMYELITTYLDNKCYRVVEGNAEQATELLKYKFDLIFYTGSTKIGKIVSKAASKYLTPTVLELGGKNPVIVDDNVDLNVVANRIAWGRWCLNCGQVCLSPEYIIIKKELQTKMLEALKNSIKKYFGNEPLNCNDYGRIINKFHFNRLKKILNDNKKYIGFGGKSNKKLKYISPTILINVDNSASIMKDEVFGPIISIFPVNNVKMEAISLINSKPKPLALYIFSNNQTYIDKVIDRTDSGGVTINDVITHFAFPGLPFGGIGLSGMGRYHGKYSFDTFSFDKPILHKSFFGESLNAVRTPPYTDFKSSIYKSLTEEKPKSQYSKYFTITPLKAAAIGAAAWFLQSKL